MASTWDYWGHTDNKKEPLVFRHLLNAAAELEKQERIYGWKSGDRKRKVDLTSTPQLLFYHVDPTEHEDKDLKKAKQRFFGK